MTTEQNQTAVLRFTETKIDKKVCRNEKKILSSVFSLCCWVCKSFSVRNIKIVFAAFFKFTTSCQCRSNQPAQGRRPLLSSLCHRCCWLESPLLLLYSSGCPSSCSLLGEKKARRDMKYDSVTHEIRKAKVKKKKIQGRTPTFERTDHRTSQMIRQKGG